MRRLFVLAVVWVAAVAVGAQETSPVLRARVFAPDGSPVRNHKVKLHLKLQTNGSLVSLSPITVKIDGEGVLTCEQPENLNWREREALNSLERERGKRVIAWVYLLVPEVGVAMTRRFFWTVGEPLPDLHLKPLARLKVQFVCPVFNIPTKGDRRVRRADDADAIWETEWVPADEWLTVTGMSVKLRPGEERLLTIPVMPSPRVPVYLRVQKPHHGQSEPRREPLPPLLANGSLLVGDYGAWRGWVEVDRTDPFQFVFVPPHHLLRVPVEQLEMRPFFDAAPSLDGYGLHPAPITEVECEVVESAGVKFLGWKAYWLNTRVMERWERAVEEILFPSFPFKSLREELGSLVPQPLRESLSEWLEKSRLRTHPHWLGRERAFKLWLTRWTPTVVQAVFEAGGSEYFVPVPVKGWGVRQRLAVEFHPPKQEPPKIAPLKTGRLEGLVQTLDGKPLEVTVCAQFAEGELVERLTEDDGSTYFLTNTDKQGRFVFPKLPEGKYDLWLESLEWVSCAEAVVKAGKTTEVKLTALKWLLAEQPPHSPRKQPLTLQFLFPDGTPVAGYRFYISPSGQVRPSEGRTDEEGCVSLEKVEVKELWVSLHSDYYGDLLCSFPLRVPSEDQTRIVIAVPVPLEGLVEGRVLLPDGSTDDKVLVSVWKLGEGIWGRKFPHLVRRLRVLPDGRFFCSLPEGNYVFKAEPMPRDHFSSNYAPSLSPPVTVKAGEVVKVEWKLNPPAKCNLQLAYPQFEGRPPNLWTVRVRTEHGDGQFYESKFDPATSIVSSILLEPLASLEQDEKVLWGDNVAPGFYRLTSWGWSGEEFNAVVRIGGEDERLLLTPPSAFPTLTVKGQVLLPNGEPAPNAVVALYDPDQKMKRWATICDGNGQFSLSVKIPTADILHRQHLDTLLPGSKGELWLIAWKDGYGHSLIHRLPRPENACGVKTDVGSLVLSRPERLEGRVVDENGESVPFVRLVALPLDTSLFMPKPDKETVMRELTAFEDLDVGSIPYAQADINGQFRVEGLRRGQYLLVVRSRFWENGELKEAVAYQLVNVPTGKVTVQVERLKGTLTAEPADPRSALPFAEVEVWMPCWRLQFRGDELGRLETDGVPKFEGVPMIVRVMHRDGLTASFNPPKDWRYVVQMRP